MTQKGDLFKGKKKLKTISPNRHGKVPHIRKGERVVKPSKMTKEMDADRELTKFINHCNEIKVATVANKDGVYNHRARVLGGGSVFNAWFYSHAETDFVKEAGLNETLVNDSYQWIEKKGGKSPAMQRQSAARDGLLEAGVLPFNEFTYDHIYGTKIGATIFDIDGYRHSAADLLEYADPKKIKIYLHAMVPKIMFTTETLVILVLVRWLSADSGRQPYYCGCGRCVPRKYYY